MDNKIENFTESILKNSPDPQDRQDYNDAYINQQVTDDSIIRYQLDSKAHVREVLEVFMGGYYDIKDLDDKTKKPIFKITGARLMTNIGAYKFTNLLRTVMNKDTYISDIQPEEVMEFWKDIRRATIRLLWYGKVRTTCKIKKVDVDSILIQIDTRTAMCLKRAQDGGERRFEKSSFHTIERRGDPAQGKSGFSLFGRGQKTAPLERRY